LREKNPVEKNSFSLWSMLVDLPCLTFIVPAELAVRPAWQAEAQLDHYFFGWFSRQIANAPRWAVERI
jgi:hypothetical protein